MEIVCHCWRVSCIKTLVSYVSVLTFSSPNRLCLGVIISLMDLSIISTALYTISLDFGSYRQTIWAALAYILTDIGCAVFFTRLADVFGRKQTILISYFFFTCFSLAGGFAQTVEQLILFRTLQGIGGTGLYSLTMVILPEISPPKFLPIMVSLLGLSVATSGVMGPVIGGVITGSTTWRWIFWLKYVIIKQSIPYNHL
jgi:MFS family permease